MASSTVGEKFIFTKLMHKKFFKNKKTRNNFFILIYSVQYKVEYFQVWLKIIILCRMRYLSVKHVLLFSLHNQNQQLPEEGNSSHGLLSVIVNNGSHFRLLVTCRSTVG